MTHYADGTTTVTHYVDGITKCISLGHCCISQSLHFSFHWHNNRKTKMGNSPMSTNTQFEHSPFTLPPRCQGAGDSLMKKVSIVSTDDVNIIPGEDSSRPPCGPSCAPPSVRGCRVS